MNFESLYDYWFMNRNLWFNSTLDDDKIISETFGNLYNETIEDEKMKINRKYAIGVILLYDQISRHVLRIKNEDLIYFWTKDSFLKETNDIALLHSASAYLHFKHEINADEYSFIMLPQRHTFDFKRIKYVMFETWDRLKEEKDEFEKIKYKQFLKATYERTITQSDDYEFVKKYSNLVEIDGNNRWENFKLSIQALKEKYVEILDKKCTEEIEKIGELDFVEKESILTLSNLFIKDLNKVPKNPLILSISGGVDSMVCSYILKKANISFKCVHINYSNRKESLDEENFVIDWCKILNVDLYVRKIDEINRPICMEYNMREMYETYTRDVRYGTYKKVYLNPYVILGHNQDDCFENILTNISHKSKYENLFGMELEGPINSNKQIINFVRPMLKISKKSIYNFAKIINIPFVWDSTPKWSQRGKIRDDVRPTLESWDSEIILGLFHMSNALKESLELVDILVNSWINKIENNKIKQKIDDLPLSEIFWKKFFQKLKIECSSRSLDGLINIFSKLKNNQLKIDINACIKYEVNKYYQFKLMKLKDGIVTIFFNKRT